MGLGAAIAQGVLRGVQGAGLTKLEQLKEEARQLREDNLLKAKELSDIRVNKANVESTTTGQIKVGEAKAATEQKNIAVGMLNGLPVTQGQLAEDPAKYAGMVPLTEYGQNLELDTYGKKSAIDTTARGKEVAMESAADIQKAYATSAINMKEAAQRLNLVSAEQKRANAEKAAAVEQGLKATSASGVLGVADEVIVDAIRNGIDPKIFEKAKKNVSPEVLKIAFESVNLQKGAEDRPLSEKAIEAASVADLLSGLGPDAQNQFADMMQRTAAGTITEPQIRQAVDNKKLTKEEATILLQYVPKDPKAAPTGVLSRPTGVSSAANVDLSTFGVGGEKPPGSISNILDSFNDVRARNRAYVRSANKK